MTTVWKGTLEFGGVSVPVRMGVAAREIKVDFRLLNPATGSGVRQRWADSKTGEEVARSALVRAADVDGRTVLVSDEELAELAPAPVAAIDLVEFVKVDDVDPTYYSNAYHLLPLDDPEDPAYHLVAAALEAGRGYAALGHMVLRQRSHYVLVRASGGALVLHTLYRAGEVRQPEGLCPTPVAAQQLRYARRLVKDNATRWAPEKFIDHHRLAVLDLVRRKRQDESGDLTTVLKAAVSRRGKSGPASGQGETP